jgi:cystathionine gamma-synthase
MSLTPAEAGRRAQCLAAAQRRPERSIATLCAHAEFEEGRDNAPLAPPLHMATTYVRPADGQYRPDDSIYSRIDHPTRVLLERHMTQLECGRQSITENWCLALSSGMMAVTTILLAHSLPLHILLPLDTYHGVPSMIEDVFVRFATSQMLTYERVDMRGSSVEGDNDRTNNLAQALQRCSDTANVIVWMETPSNPLCHVIDVEAICQLVRSVRPLPNTTLVVDATLAPPTLRPPLLTHSGGVDLVVHSATKYLGGHSDSLGGLVVVSPHTSRGRALRPLLRRTQTATGGVLSGLDAWLLLRGLRTLPVRVARQSATALLLARYMQGEPRIVRVHYPGLPPNDDGDDPQQYVIAEQQMPYGMFGGVLSIELATETEAMALAGAVMVLQRATSLGGTETLIEHRASIEPDGLRTSPVGLLRISVGLEDPEDLLADLQNALRIMEEVCYPGEVG